MRGLHGQAPALQAGFGGLVPGLSDFLHMVLCQPVSPSEFPGHGKAAWTHVSHLAVLPSQVGVLRMA